MITQEEFFTTSICLSVPPRKLNEWKLHFKHFFFFKGRSISLFNPTPSPLLISNHQIGYHVSFCNAYFTSTFAWHQIKLFSQYKSICFFNFTLTTTRFWAGELSCWSLNLNYCCFPLFVDWVVFFFCFFSELFFFGALCSILQEDVDSFMKQPGNETADSALRKLDEQYQKYKYMELNLSQKKLR